MQQEWKAHFTNQPIVKSCLFEAVSTDRGANTRLYHAIFQEDAFMIRQIGDESEASLDHIAGGALYAGRYRSNYWAIEGGRVLKQFPAADDFIKAWQSPEVSLIVAPRRILVAALFFGMHLLDPGTVQWTDNVRFVGTSYEGGAVEGRVLAVSGDLPTRFEWYAEGFEGIRFVTDCAYVKQFALTYYPSEITVRAEMGGKSHPVAQYRIISLSLGEGFMAESYFSSERFFSNSAVGAVVVVKSDGMYAEMADHSYDRVIVAPPPSIGLYAKHGLAARRLVILAVLSASTIGLVLMWRRIIETKPAEN